MADARAHFGLVIRKPGDRHSPKGDLLWAAFLIPGIAHRRRAAGQPECFQAPRRIERPAQTQGYPIDGLMHADDAVLGVIVEASRNSGGTCLRDTPLPIVAIDRRAAGALSAARKTTLGVILE